MREVIRSLVFVVAVGLSAIALQPTPALQGQAAPDQALVRYQLSFPEPEHRWMQVEVTFSEVGTAPLAVRMSRSSPGRYALHEFAKNVYDVHAFDRAGKELTIRRPDAHQWDVLDHGGTVRFVYKVYGDRVDGTYLGIDSTHAHINMPAALVWARGLEQRPADVRFERPTGSAWRVATQLYPTDDPVTFRAPNLQYLLDSPTEFSPFTLRTFTVDDPSSAGQASTFRIALHHEGTEAEADHFAVDVERIVRESVAIFGEFPEYETGIYTFIVDYLPYAGSDGMEHRNSTVLTSSGSLGSGRQNLGLLSTVAHELFHSWNAERIRPQTLEPFDFERENVSGELWLGEGFTSYYDELIMLRSGLASLSEAVASFTQLINAVEHSPARQLRSVVEMSQLAPFTDAARSVDPTNWANTFISYYTWGAAIGLGLDLSLRARTDPIGTGDMTSLDDYMRAMWQAHGKPGGRVPGLVDVPYTLADARVRLAEISGDSAFADDFFDRYVEGHEVVDYARLLEHAGLVLRKRAPGRAWWGNVRLVFLDDGVSIMAAVPFGSPLYVAGIERGDLVVSLDGETDVRSAPRLARFLTSKRPGDRVTVEFMRRGILTTATIVLEEDPRLELLPIETIGGRLTDGQRAFRAGWLGSKARNSPRARRR